MLERIVANVHYTIYTLTWILCQLADYKPRRFLYWPFFSRTPGSLNFLCWRSYQSTLKWTWSASIRDAREVKHVITCECWNPYTWIANRVISTLNALTTSFHMEPLVRMPYSKLLVCNIRKYFFKRAGFEVKLWGGDLTGQFRVWDTLQPREGSGGHPLKVVEVSVLEFLVRIQNIIKNETWRSRIR